jgi:BMFP domain-containing protein YqiC
MTEEKVDYAPTVEHIEALEARVAELEAELARQKGVQGILTGHEAEKGG